jgi:acyl-CoA reductase-like NAD-dependent aldehyde dehydrogenase
MNTIDATVRKAHAEAIVVQRQWRDMLPATRFSTIGRVAAEICQSYNELAAAIGRPASHAEILASEVIPLAEACKFTSKRGSRILANRNYCGFPQAWWMGRIGVRIQLEPWGTVLILAPWNYPLFLAGSQTIQAIAAGNAVLLKPSPGCERVSELFCRCLVAAGIPQGLVQILPSDVEAGQCAMHLGIDKVVLTGSAATGRAVLKTLADRLTPSTMELSGCDAVFVLPDADLEKVARSVAYSLALNHGATCIAPRRIFLNSNQQPILIQLLSEHLANAVPLPVRPSIFLQVKDLIAEAISQGAVAVIGSPESASEEAFRPTVLQNVKATMRVAAADVFAPISSLIQIQDMNQAIEMDSCCKYHLGASVFGSETQARKLANRIQAGNVAINDIVVPTADPRVAFGGWGNSGWGVTRGAEGLLEMARPKVIMTRRGKWMPHLDPKLASDPIVLGHILKLFHSRSVIQKLRSAMAIMAAGSKRN